MKMDPCSDKMALCYVASVCKFGANLNGPPFSFRCRSPGARGSPASTGPAAAVGDAEASQVYTKQLSSGHLAGEYL